MVFAVYLFGGHGHIGDTIGARFGQFVLLLFLLDLALRLLACGRKLFYMHLVVEVLGATIRQTHAESR